MSSLQNKNRAKREYFMQNILKKVKNEIKKSFLVLELLDEVGGHYRVMNDLGQYFDFWTTGSVMTIDGRSIKDDPKNAIFDQIKILIKNSND